MKKPTSDQWMGIVLGALTVLVVVLFVAETSSRGGFSELAPVGKGDAMPALSAPSLEGRVDLGVGQTGGKVLLLDFWATWCPPCREEMPVLADLHARYAGQGLQLWSVNTEGEEGTEAQRRLVRGFLKQEGLDVPVLLDDGRLQAAFKVQSLPTLFLVGRDGRIRRVYVGMSSSRVLERDVREALGAP